MALPTRLTSTFLPSELSFLAEDEPISIEPYKGMDGLKLIGLNMPKLSTLRHAEVPLWLALILKKQSCCAIIIPKWLNEEHLKNVYEQETKIRDRFCDLLPWRWIEISQLLLANASDDFDSSDASTIRTLLQDIREARLAKARAGVTMLNESHIQMDYLSHMEINEMRPFVCMAMDQLRRITAHTEPEPDIAGYEDIE